MNWYFCSKYYVINFNLFVYKSKLYLTVPDKKDLNSMREKSNPKA